MTTAPDPEAVREANRNRPPVDSWIDDAPITDRQLDVLRAELDNRYVAQFNKDVVRKLVRSVELARMPDKPPQDKRDGAMPTCCDALPAGWIYGARCAALEACDGKAV